jgi:hypothetical protein
MKLKRMLLVAALALMVSPFGGIGSLFAATAPAKAPAKAPAPAASKAPAPAPAAAAAPVLLNSDCGKCHREVPKDIDEAGQAHKTSVGCQDCHDGHPPVTQKIIPACSQCHSGTPHFQLDGCLTCHTNPHRPLELTIGKNLTTPCLTCHEGEGKQLKEFTSKHTTLACTTCHETTHGNVPSCTTCHEPHSATMLAADCKKCHQAHKPLAVTYAATVPSADCAACHEETLKLLRRGQPYNPYPLR